MVVGFASLAKSGFGIFVKEKESLEYVCALRILRRAFSFVLMDAHFISYGFHKIHIHQHTS